MTIKIKHYDGSLVEFNADKINRSIERACRGLTDPISKVTQIATETSLTLYDGITTEEMDKATINAAVQNIQSDIEFDVVATRILLKTVYRKVIGEYDKDNDFDLTKKHRDGFISYIKNGIENKRLDPRMAEKYNLEVLADTLDIERDELFTYAGLDGLFKRYAIRNNVDQSSAETPQYFFMRVAMGLAYNEANPTEMAKKFYNKLSRLEYLSAGSTNLAAGTINPALSNCFLLEVQDNMEHIAKSVSDVMLLSKASGGIGASLTKLRASGSPLKSNNGISSGATPFAKIMDTAIRAIIRGGKKKGAMCFYMENWHHDFPEFLDWKKNEGDDYMRMRTANTAVFISDEFMKRVEAGDDWYMFDPAETADLNELYGQAFSKRYAEYIEMAQAGKLVLWKKVPAAEQYRQILVSLQTTSHPWLTWKDTMNNRALNNNRGTIHMSNLCTEICLPQDKENIAVCNLASINLVTHLKNREINWSKLEESVRLAVRQLDNLIDINVLPIKEATKADKENRAIGLGVMGFADVLEQLSMAYDSIHAANFADRIFEFISYMAIDESANLATERGVYMHFVGSEWSKGKVPFDTIAKVEADRGELLTVDKTSHHKGLNWDVLRAKVRKGMRNSTLMAVAPTANIGLLAGVTPGIDVRFAQIFSRNKFSGKYVDINHNLVRDLQNLGLWDQVKDLIIEHQGDIAHIEGIPQHIKDVYKTSFSTSPYAVIEIAARAQKWTDQGLSRNMYLDTRDTDEIMNIYKTAWQKGLKTTYYLHMKPRHTAEQSTVNVNKAQKIGKVGFGALGLAQKFAPTGFSAPLQKSLEVEMVPEVTPVYAQEPVKIVEKREPVFEQKYDPMSSSVMADVIVDIPASPIISHTAPVVSNVVMEEAVVVVKMEGTSKGFGSLSNLNAQTQTMTKPVQTQASAPVKEKVEVITDPETGMMKTRDGKPFVCPIDPDELAACESCQ
jgi:ribonucleoside-diphosphate reductase alpha chain